ncbi:MAG: ATP-dependent DNA helicase RecG, partial [Methylophilales bacterium 16-45-7]
MSAHSTPSLLSERKGFSTALVSHLAKLGLHTLQDLILHLPIRYLDETRITAIRDLRMGDEAQVQGEIVHAEVSYKPRKALIARIQDESGQLTLRFLHFYPSQINTLKEGAKLRVYGEVRHGFFGYEMVHPQCKKWREDAPVNTQLTPVYPTTAGLPQANIRKAVMLALEQNILFETLPAWVYAAHQMPSFSDSIRTLHQPAPHVSLEALQARTLPAWRRLALDELLAQQLSMRKHYAKRRSLDAPSVAESMKLVPALLQHLAFQLTNAQKKVVTEIANDLSQPHPMQRLLQGDVGSGKTIVACVAALQAIEHGWQVALMAPTEILAEQHFKKFTQWLVPLNIHIAWLTGSQSKKERAEALNSIADGTAQMVVGTHALFQDAVQFKRLGLAIVDEQHRFGVQQRLALRQKGQPEP